MARLLKPLTGLDSERSGSKVGESGTDVLCEVAADGAAELCCASWEQTVCDSCKGTQAGTADDPEADLCVQSTSSKSYRTTQLSQINQTEHRGPWMMMIIMHHSLTLYNSIYFSRLCLLNASNQIKSNVPKPYLDGTKFTQDPGVISKCTGNTLILFTSRSATSVFFSVLH